MKKSQNDDRTQQGENLKLLEELKDLKDRNDLLMKENRSLTREIVKYKGQLIWHLKNGNRLMELLKDAESDRLLPMLPEEPLSSRAIDLLNDDEINRLIEEKRKIKE
jgi:hypothetical protein